MRLLVLALAALSIPGQAPPKPRIPVLVLTGENGTDWRWSSTWMRAFLEDSGRFDVEIATYPDATMSDRYNAARFDVFVLDYEGLRWSELAETNFLELVAGGKGVVAVGGSARAFPEWEEYRAVLGCRWDDAGGADPFGPVKIRGRDQHDLVEGFGDWSNHEDVLLLGIEPNGTTHETLGVVERTNPGTGEVETVPVVVVGQYGEGRVVTSTLGHVSFGDPRTQASQTDPQYQQFLIRACEWAATGETSTISRVEPNTLTEADRAAGWQLLFDGDSAKGWGEYGGEGMPADRWSVQGGTLIANPVEGDQVLAAQAFDEFEVEVEWRVAGGAGADVRVVPDGGIVSDGYGVDRGGQSIRIMRPDGEFNHSRVVATMSGVEQWFNGVRIATYPMTPGEWAYRMTGDRARNDPELAQNMPLLRVVRENDGASVWFRNIRIRRIDSSTLLPAGAAPADAFIDLFNGKNLEGWTWVPWTQNNNSAPAFEVQDGLMINRATPIGYLRTDASYGDFELEFDWRMNPQTRQGGRAGVMIRMQPTKQRARAAVQNDIFWPRAIDVRLGTNEAGDVHAVRDFPMQADRRRFNGLVARRMRNMEHRSGEWNHSYVRLERGELVVRLNGEVVNAATAVGGAPGPIAIKADGVEVQFRNVTLRPIPD
ncbi:MAG: family 16 glycoside hydrolase [Planctomycetota bacterium]